MARLLVLASLAAIVAASSMASRIQGYPRGLESLFGTKREVANEKEKERSVCESDECKLIAKVMKDSMNEDIDPCDDFYEYACGQWSNNNPAPENTSTWSLWNMVADKVEKQVEEIIEGDAKPDDLFVVKLAKMWFKSCMNTEAEEKRGVEPILSTLWRHGGWPLIMQDAEWDSRIYNWQIVDDHFTRLLGFNALHDVRYGYATYDSNRSILIETPHMPLGLYTLITRSPPLISDSSDENNESGEGSQEPGSKERGSNKGDEDEEKDEDEDSGIDEDDSDNDVETDEQGEELQKKRVSTRKHKRLGHGKKHNKKIAGQSISARKTRKRTKRDIVEAKILRRMLRNLRKLSKTKSHQAKKTKGTSSKRGHLSADKGKTSVKKNQGAGEQKHSVAHSKKLGHEKSAKDKEVEEQQKKKETKKKNKRLGHGNRKSKKSKVTRRHAHESKAKAHTLKHKQSKISNHKTHRVAKKVQDNTDENNNSVGDDEENADNGDSDGNGEDDNGSADEDGNGGSDEEGGEDDEGNDEEDDDEKDGDEEDEEDDEEDEEDDEDDEDDEEYDEDVNVEELKEEYRQYILDVSLILSKGRGIEIPRERLEKDIADLVEFAIKLGQLTLLEDDDPVITTLNDFQRAYNTLESNSPNSKVNWKRKIQKVFDEAGVELDDDVEITITCQNYLRKLKQLLDETPSTTIVNYVHWLFLCKMSMFSTTEMKDLTDKWLGGTMFDSRKEQCIMQVEMNDAVGYQYVKKHFSSEIAATARDMIDDIQKEVEYQIKESTWMDEDTQHFVLDKLVAMKNMVGHPDWYLNDTAVSYYFRGLTIGPSYYENIMNYVRNMKWQRLRNILQEEESDSSEMVDPLMLNAFFMPMENSITITAVDFQNPFFALNRPWSINYGIIGVIMGHEVNHGFDDEGRLFDRKGNPMEWLSAMADAYNRRAECFVDQFNSYSIFKNENYTVENYGNQTIGENIADTMGLQAVYRAYQRRQRECKKPDPALPGFENFDNDQIFFLSFANLWCDNEDRESVIASAKYDVHSTGRLRVIGSVSNSKDFARAYNCPVGSPMNPERKCNIWI